MTDLRDLQQRVLNGDLYRQVVDTELAMRSRTEYDVGTADERRFAILCWALERGSLGTAGTFVSRACAIGAMEALRAEAE
jgi:hypothetical protein